eukprot:EG_transcript_24965
MARPGLRGPGLSLLLCLCLGVLVPGNAGWSVGDVVPMMERSLYNGEVTPWRVLGPVLSPRFGKSKSVRVHSPAAGDTQGAEFKISFELGHDLGWKTPWILVGSGCKNTGSNATAGPPEEAEKCLHLTEIHFTFKYEKNIFGKITGFKWKPIYIAEPVKQITLHYVWHEISDYDLNSALHFIYGFSFFGSIAFAFCLTLTSATVRRGEMLVRDVKTN